MRSTAIITVNYFSADYTLRLISEIIAYSTTSPYFDIYIIDNSESREESHLLLSGIFALLDVHQLDHEIKSKPWSFIETSRLGIGLHIAEKNQGFGAGCNLGARLADGNANYDWIWFLNNDCSITSSTLDEFAEFSETTDFGAFGTSMQTIHSGITKKQYGVGAIKWWHGTTSLYSYYDKIQCIDYIHGSSLAIRFSYFMNIGGFDEDYFHFYEETDLCVRASLHCELGLAKKVDVIHYCGGSSGNSLIPGRTSLFCDYYAIRNRFLFTLKLRQSYIIPVLLSVIGYIAVRMYRRQYSRVLIVPKAIISAFAAYLGLKVCHPEVNNG